MSPTWFVSEVDCSMQYVNALPVTSLFVDPPRKKIRISIVFFYLPITTYPKVYRRHTCGGLTDLRYRVCIV